MLKLTHRSALILAAGLILAFLSSAGTALAKKPRPLSCATRSGSTLLENGSTRVFRHSGKVYACRRPKGRARLVFVPRGYRKISGNKVSDIQLAGHYVAFEQLVMESASIWLLDVGNGKVRSIGGADDQSHLTLGGYALNSHGTVVWVTNHFGCLSPCEDTGTLTATTATGRATQLDQSTEVTPTTPQAPITDLGLSTSGLVVYWTDKGVARSARIP